MRKLERDPLTALKKPDEDPNLFFVPASIIQWLAQEVREAAEKSTLDGEGSFLLVVGERIEKGALEIRLTATKEDSTYLLAVRELLEAAERGKRLAVKLPTKERATSAYVGELGKTLETDVELYKVIRYTGGNYGTVFIHLMRDAVGNELVWFSSGGKKVDEGFYHLKATVKGHSTYDKRAQTKVNYCKFS